ncbi:hypothetical protein E5D57_007390 [Metarhizium anisopliae]|nr:hypothetical protein E5D57_007390 [Metarhizium anisopliae]
MPSNTVWPHFNTTHERPSSPNLSSPVKMVLVDDTNMQPTEQPHQGMFNEQVEPEQHDGVNIFLMKRRESSRYRDDGNTGKPAEALLGLPTERDSMWEDDIPYSGRNSRCDEAPQGGFSEQETASIPPVLGQTHTSFSQRRGFPRHKTFPESVYNTAPPGTDPTTTGPSRESEFSVAGEYSPRPMSRPVGKPGAHYSLADMDQFASPPATNTTFAKGINSASYRCAPLRYTRHSSSTTTTDSELRSDRGLSQRTSTTTTCSSSVRNSARRSNKGTRPPSAASRRASSRASQERYYPPPRTSRTSGGKQIGGWSTSRRTSDESEPISQKRPPPRTIINKYSLPAAGTQPMHTLGEHLAMVEMDMGSATGMKRWCRKCLESHKEIKRKEEEERREEKKRIGKIDTQKRRTSKEFQEQIRLLVKFGKLSEKLGIGGETSCIPSKERCAGHEVRCIGYKNKSAAREERCATHQKEDAKPGERCVGEERICVGHGERCWGYQQKVSMSKEEKAIAKWRVAKGGDGFPYGLRIENLPHDSVARITNPWWL